MLILGIQNLNHFQCTASACPKNCCTAGWSVLIDEDILRYYRSLDDEFGRYLNKTLDEYLVVRGNRSYLDMRGGRCPFLTEEGLCSVQLTLGEEHLGITCAIFPRLLNSCGNLQVVYMSISCPECARILLLEPDGLDVELVDEDSDRDFDTFSFVEYEGGPSPDSISKDALLICIAIAQNRAFSIEQRQRLIIIFTRMLQDALDGEEYEKCLDICQYFADPSSYAALVEDEKKSFHMTEKATLLRFLSAILEHPKAAEVTENLHCTLQQLQEIDVDKMLRLHNWLDNMNSSRETQLENLLVYFLLRHYLSNEASHLFDNTVFAVIFLQTYRILAASALLRGDGQFSDEDGVLLLCGLSKCLENHKLSVMKIYDVLREERDDFTFLYRLIS